MHRKCRVIAVLRNQCGCRLLATSSGAQLKPKQSNATPIVPTPKTWGLPPKTQSSSYSPSDLPTRKDWSRPTPAPSHTPSRSSVSPSENKWSRPLPPMQRQAPSGSPRAMDTRQPDAPTASPREWSRSPPTSSTHSTSVSDREFRKARSTSSSENIENRPHSSESTAATSQKPGNYQSTPSTPQSAASTRRQQPSPSTQISSQESLTSSPTTSSPPLTSSSKITPTTVESNSQANRAPLQPAVPKPQHSQTQGHNSQDQRSTVRKNSVTKSTDVQGRMASKKPMAVKSRPAKSSLAGQRARRRDVFIPFTLTVSTLARILRLKLDYVLSRMRRIGMVDEASYDYILNADYAALLADELGFNPIIDDEAAFDIHPPPPHPNPSSLPSRPPIVTIMGHVDHGKTTLLDTLRSASVAKGEAGGITQHIGAFSVPVKVGQGTDATTSQMITFLDTPGHAAFSAMRARGADVTDIIVLVVAADDGIMPQTKEVISLLKKEEAETNLVVAINKIDKPGVDTDVVKKALMTEGVQLEEFGGEVPSVAVSGLTGQGLPDLVEVISAVAEMLDLRAEQDGLVFGHVLESNVHKGLGNVATVLVRRGALKRGSLIISGLSHGKVRLMTDSRGVSVDKALPGMAVTVSGWKTLPKAGDEVLEGSDADIKKALSNRVRKAEADSMQQDIEVINAARRQERDARADGGKEISSAETSTGPKQLKLFIKADVSGSGEALQGAIDGMGNKVVVSKVIATGIGDVSESDVMRAQAANATIVAFSVSVPRSIRMLATRLGIPIISSDIIYRVMEDVRSSLVALLPLIIETKVLGEADVLQVFDIELKGGKTMKVAGCRVINGLVQKHKSARVVRAGEVIHQGPLDTFRQLNKDITEARKGVECGISLRDFSDLQAGDMIQMYDTIEKPGIL